MRGVRPGANLLSHKPPFHHPAWAEVDHAAALRLAGITAANPREHLEKQFSYGPVQEMHLTGYFEPEYPGSLTRTDQFQHPIYRLPPEDLRQTKRADVYIALRGYELAWLADPLDAYLVQVQGSGRIVADAGVLRVGYAGKNQAPYVSIGKILVENGSIEKDKISMQTIRDWANKHPRALPRLLANNPSFVYFQKMQTPDHLGPIGTAGIPLTPMASIAVDPDVIPLGSKVWISAPGINTLTIAQDTGGAIKGARIDLFTGTGSAAGEVAGMLNTTVVATVLQDKAGL